MCWNELCIWKKKKNDGFWTNRGFEISKDYISETQKNHGLRANCVFGKRRKLIGFGRTVDLKLVQVMQRKGRKIMGLKRTVYLEEEENSQVLDKPWI